MPESKEEELVFDENAEKKDAVVSEEKESKKTDAELDSKKNDKKKTKKGLSEESQPKKTIVPKLFFKKDERIEIAINGYHDAKTGEFMFGVPIDGSETEENDSDSYICVKYHFWFSPCKYDALARYRSYSMIYNREGENNTVNLIRLREFFLVNNLIDWDLKDENGDKIMLEFDTNKSLSKKSLDVVYLLPANLLDLVLICYERKIGVIS